MSRYRVVHPEFWTGETGRQIVACGPDALACAFYLLTCPESDSTGVFSMPLPLLAYRIGSPIEGASKGLMDLERVGFITRREGSDWLFVKKMAKYQVGAVLKPGDKRAALITGRLDVIRKAGFLNDFLDEYADAFGLSGVPREEAPSKGHRSPIEGASKGVASPIEASNSNSTSNSTRELVMGGARESGAEPPDPTPPDPTDEPPVEPVEPDPPEPPDPPDKPVRVAPTPESIELARRFADALVAVKPDLKLPTCLDRWANSFRLMVERDGRTRERIERMIAYLPTDEFWRTVILSAEKFREKFDKLELAAARPSFLPKTAAEKTSDAFTRYAERNFRR